VSIELLSALLSRGIEEVMDLPEALRRGIVAWAERNACVREVWLFGSRVKGNPKKNDVDIAIYFIPPAEIPYKLGGADGD
jgi:predicted nucleotidyltransferase